MSDDQKDAAVGRLVMQRSEAKKIKTLLENELRSAGNALYEIGSVLKYFGSPYDSVEGVFPLLAKAPDICGLERITEMLTELKGIKEKVAQLDRSAAEFGISA